MINKYLKTQLITYIGNKRKLIFEIEAEIKEIMENLNKEKVSFADVFAGSGVVSRLAKSYSSKIYSNDLEIYASIINKAYLANYSKKDIKDIKDKIKALNEKFKLNPIKKGFIRKNYSPKDEKSIKTNDRVFYTNRNAEFIDTALVFINKEIKNEKVKNFLLANLIVQSSIHVNTSGVFKGFYKNINTKKGQFGGNGKNALKRIKGHIKIEEPIFENHNTDIFIYQKESLEFAKSIPKIDIAYLDPPYNQHPYGSNYFMLNLIATNDKPLNLSKVSGIPENWKRSNYNKRAFAADTLFSLCRNIKAKYLIISYNSDGFVKKKQFIEELEKIGTLAKQIEIKYNTFRGSRNLKERDIHVKEYIFVVKKNG